MRLFIVLSVLLWTSSTLAQDAPAEEPTAVVHLLPRLAYLTSAAKAKMEKLKKLAAEVTAKKAAHRKAARARIRRDSVQFKQAHADMEKAAEK